VQGLSNERIQIIVRAKGETALLSKCTDAAMEEESGTLSAKEKGFTIPSSSAGNEFRGPGRGSGFTNLERNRGSSAGNVFRGPGRGSGFTTLEVYEGSSTGNVFRGPGRGSEFITLEGNGGFRHPGRGVGFSTNGGTVRRAHVLATDVAREHVIMSGHEKIRCHACGALGHISRNCRKSGNATWKDNKSAGTGEQSLWKPSRTILGCSRKATTAINTVTVATNIGVKGELKFVD
jgi:hypothetical protein